VQESKTGILAQNTPPQERKLRLHWLLAVSAIPLFGIVTAFGIAPQTATRDVPVSTVIEEVALPAAVEAVHAAALAPQPLWQVDQVRRDDTLASLLNRVNIRNPEALDFLRQSPEARALSSQLRPGHSILVKTTDTGELLSLQYQTSANSALLVQKNDQGYRAEEKLLAMESRTLVKSARIHSSLFAATDDAGIPDRIAMQLADIFSSEIDFHLDLRTGDHFTVVYEADYNNGELVKTGRVLATEFVNQGKTYRALLYRDPLGQEGYYATDGKNLHKAFLRSPLEFSRISSGFTLARFHPILQTWRAHKGVDYAAPIGTRVKSTADATVAFAGTQASYGNVVILQHRGGISTVYGHLSHIALGLRKGTTVTQGEVIGFVGMTGLATGPHLHYEFRVHGEHRDPLKIAMPNAAPVPSEYHADFAYRAQSPLAQLNLLQGTNTASLE